MSKKADSLTRPAILNVSQDLHDGDIVLFSGETLFSHTIRTATKSRWSHCGMAVNDSDKGGTKIWDVSKKTFGGVVALYDLQKRIAEYHGAIAYRPLRYNGKQRGFATRERKAFDDIYQSLLGRPYETSKLELFNAAIDIKILDYELARNEPDLSSIFCGELIAETYQMLGLLGRNVPANEYVPADFGAGRLDMLENDYSLGDEILIKEILD